MTGNANERKSRLERFRYGSMPSMRGLLKAPFYVLDSFLAMIVTYLPGEFGNYLRYRYYKKRLKHLGEGSRIDQGVIITEPWNVSLGDYVFIDKYVIILGGRGVQIGRRVHVAQNCLIQGVGLVKIGDYAGLSAYCKIYSASESYEGGKRMSGPMVPSEYRNVKEGAVIMEKDSFLGAGTTVLPGVRIGEGAVIGASSLVLNDIAPWTVAVGIPAKPIKKRPKVTVPDI